MTEASVMLVRAVIISICTIWLSISEVSMLLSIDWFWSCTTIRLRKSVRSSEDGSFFRVVECFSSG